MSKFVDEEVARVIRRRRVKTFGDKIKEFFEGLAGLIVIVLIVVAIFT